MGDTESSCFYDDSLVLMADGITKPIKDVQIGDMVARGGKVTGVMQFTNKQGLCKLGENLFATPHHKVYHEGEWKHTMNTMKSFNYIHSLFPVLLCNEKADIVYDINTENHVIEWADGFVTTDFDEHDEISDITKQEEEITKENLKAYTKDIGNLKGHVKKIEATTEEEIPTPTTPTKYSLVLMADGTYKPDYSIKIGDTVSRGGKVTGLAKLEGGKDLCRITPNILFVKNDLVYYDGEWQHAVDIVEGEGKFCNDETDAIFELVTENHVVEYAGGFITPDFLSVDSVKDIEEKEFMLVTEMLKDHVKDL